MDIPKGWSFYSADFSRQAMGTSNFGSVTLIRDTEDRKRWHKLPESVKDCTEECPTGRMLIPLYVYGQGANIENAFAAAHQSAARAGVVPNVN
jgi:hypothetical protein